MRSARVLFMLVVLAIMAVALVPMAVPAVDVSHVDKLEHAAAFALLWLLGRRAGFSRLSLALGLLAYGGLIELAQGALTTTRQADVMDWLADAAGMAVGAGLEYVWLRRRASPSSS